MATYKIEGLDRHGRWTEEQVGTNSEANRFPTREQAEAEIPALAAAFECPESTLRVVECDAD